MSRKVPVPELLLVECFSAALASSNYILGDQVAEAIQDAADNMTIEGLSLAQRFITQALQREQMKADNVGMRFIPASEWTSALDVVTHLRRKLAGLRGEDLDDMQVTAEKLLGVGHA